ncbi:hypothetical protein IU459_11905 [Nocardia amamiensis]|uniref:Uncharacterized protein n=1 Tax=Nocardia amamiensis TaxID=404578 RepID=A0ABS0CNV3_9NOCA|nr:hypothetical protein [Nocardia amamiensis]MBF6298245.1 hypothetical protein [Nocardia amamiensis]
MKPIHCLLGRHDRRPANYSHPPCADDNREYGYLESRCVRCQPPAPETRAAAACKCTLPRDRTSEHVVAQLHAQGIKPDGRYARLFTEDALLVVRRRKPPPEMEIDGRGYTPERPTP